MLDGSRDRVVRRRLTGGVTSQLGEPGRRARYQRRRQSRQRGRSRQTRRRRGAGDPHSGRVGVASERSPLKRHEGDAGLGDGVKDGHDLTPGDRPSRESSLTTRRSPRLEDVASMKWLVDGNG